MPPLDLGFRGLTSASDHEAVDSSAHNLAQNYQSDESENKPSLIKRPRLPMASKQVAHNLFLSGRQNPTASESTTYNLLGKTHIPTGFQSSLHANRAEGNSQYNWNPQNVYAPREFRPLHETRRNAPQYEAGDRQNSYESSINNFRQQDLTFGGKPNTPYKNPYAQWHANQYGNSRQTLDWNTNAYQTDQRKPEPVSQSAWYDANQPWNGEHTDWMDPLDSKTHSSDLSQLHMETLAVGHPSNYQEITEEEVRRRMQEYNKDLLVNSNLNLPTLPSLPGQNSIPQTGRHLGASQHNTGLLLVGSKEHDKTVRNFQSLASEWSLTGVETLFDEIDTNRDGMIKIEELRNFLWLHEVAVPN
ncbi:hypothetical protein EG68_04523 [Paragonimus skrjabini miyazakii]|uniref:EF-hand domain-containing protein n=1 Tax=Paragonimus skrjabini miyazakii TaxID=59628 RepID=A0A8S9YU12_9TREM|nr:hypothetical protein EG68_04523 [Paragonimus skrjabini miyazakii]